MPTIFDNVERNLRDELRQVMADAVAGDFCVGYFNPRGWGQLADLVDGLPGNDESCCRVVVGMHRPPEEEMRAAYGAIREDKPLDVPAIRRLEREASEGFKRQIEFGVPTDDAEDALRRLARQLRAGQVRVKLFLPYPSHAKLYMVHRPHLKAPLVGYVGSSNLTLSGLTRSGELDVDVVEQDAADKLHEWFHRHWDEIARASSPPPSAWLLETLSGRRRASTCLPTSWPAWRRTASSCAARLCADRTTTMAWSGSAQRSCAPTTLSSGRHSTPGSSSRTWS